jgi:hypothetical protein
MANGIVNDIANDIVNAINNFIARSKADSPVTTSNTGFIAKIESKCELIRCDSEISNKSNPGNFL